MTDAALLEKPAYTVTARLLHWVVAVIVLGMIVVGVIIANEWGGPWQEQLYNAHKSTGAVVLVLIVLRLLYRLTHPPAPLPADIPALQQFVAHSTHWILYALLIVQPLVGWIATSAYPAPLPFYGLFDLPAIWPADRAVSDQLFGVHRMIGIAIAFVAAAHIGAALFHHFVRRDRVLMRMISG